MSLKLFGVQFGQSGTATNNITAAVPSPGDGTWKLSRGNFGATTQDILTVDATNAVTVETTPASTDNSKKIINTAWAKLGFVILKASPGYIKFPDWMGGLIIQWGIVTSPNGTGSASFPLTFSTLLGVYTTMQTGLAAGLMWCSTVTSSSTTGINVTRRYMSSGGGGSADAGEAAWWLAFGY